MTCRFEMDCHNLVEEFLHLGKLENKIRACSQALRDGLVPEPLSPAVSPAGALSDADTLYSKNQIVLSILADFTGSLIVLGRIC